MSSSINHAHSLGKGEVESSILSGSTRKALEWAVLGARYSRLSAVSRRTSRELDSSTRGKSVDFVHGSIMEDSMTKTPLCAEEKFIAMIDEACVIGAHELGLHSSVMAAVLRRKADEEDKLAGEQSK